MRLTGVAMLGVVISLAGVLVGQHVALRLPAAIDGTDAMPARMANQAVAAAPQQAPAQQAGARRVYPFSIVPGGVLDRAELAAVIKRDKVAAAHYADIQVDKVVPVKVAKARAVYVSYRKDGQVYWTSRKVMLAEGEILLSDGVNEIRTRCGNRISETRRLPVAANEPAPQVLDTAMEAGDADEGGVQPIGMASLDDGPGAIGATHSAVTFASGNGLVQVAAPGNGWMGTALPGMSDLPRPYNGRPATIAAPQASQINPAAPASGTGGANGGAAVGSRGNGGTGTRTLATSISASPSAPGPADALGDAPVLGTIDAPPPSGTPELPPLPATLAPVPDAPLVPVQPNADLATVPEPGSLWLSGIALAALALLRRRPRRAC